MSHPGVDFGHPPWLYCWHVARLVSHTGMLCPATLASLIAREFQEPPNLLDVTRDSAPTSRRLHHSLRPVNIPPAVPHPTLARGCVPGWRRHCRIYPANVLRLESMSHQRLTTTHSLTASRSHGLTRPSRLEVSNSYHPGVNMPQSDGREQIAVRHQHCDQAQTTDGKPEP